MRDLVTLTHLTLLEAARKRILLALLVCGLAFQILFAFGFHFGVGRMGAAAGMNLVEHRIALTMMTLAGLYAVHFLLVMAAVLLPVDTLSGDIESGLLQTFACRPVRRSSILLGKWLGYVIVTLAYFALMAGGVLLSARVFGGFTPPGVAPGVAQLALGAVLMVTLSIAGGARLATVTNGVLAFGLFGLAFIGTWIEQVGVFTHNNAARNIGTIASLVLPVEAMWQRAAAAMQPALMLELQLSPFSPGALPSVAMVWWAVGYTLAALVFALGTFSRRAL